MQAYVALVNWTQKGIQEFGESPSRVDKFRICTLYQVMQSNPFEQHKPQRPRHLRS